MTKESGVLVLLSVIAIGVIFLLYRAVSAPLETPSSVRTGNGSSSEQTQKSMTPTQQNTSPQDLHSVTTAPGAGDRTVVKGDTVAVRYTGKLTDGTVFDATDRHGGTPFTFTVGAGQVIAGWDQGVVGARIGEKRTLTIPPELGYGARGFGSVIPPNATLIFDIDIVSIQ